MGQNSHNEVRRTQAWRRQRDGGYLLLAVLLMMALMIIAATIVAPRVVQQIKRDREEEMIHRGTEYARAIKKFYKKNGRYPSNLDDLDKGQIKYLRKRYKDPLTKDGKWKLLNYGDIQTLLNAAAPGTPAGALAAQSGAFGGSLSPGGAVLPSSQSGNANNFGFGAQPQQQSQQLQFQQVPGSNSGFTVPSGQGASDPNIVNLNNSASGNSQALAADSQSTTDGQQSANSSAFGNSNTGNNSSSGQQGTSPFGQNTAGGSQSGNQTFGGGAVVGVGSMSKDPTIRIYNKKKTYNEWQFIYNPMMDQPNVLLRGPYQPITIGGAQIGTPAGQMNGQQQNGLGQQNSGFGQQNSGSGQQNSFGQQPSAPQQPQQPFQPSTGMPEQNQPQ